MRIPIRRLHLADVTYPEDWVRRWYSRAQGATRTGGDETWPVFAYVVLHPDGPLLVDTGIGPAHPLIDRLYRPVRSDLRRELARAGVAIEDVIAVVNSHLHFDHCGNNRLFARCPIFVQASEYAAAQGVHYTIPEWVGFSEARYEQVHGRHEIRSGVELIPSPGHTPGHQSVLVTDDEGRSLIVAQAAYTLGEYDEPEPGHPLGGAGIESPEERRLYLDSLRALRALGPDTVYLSHDS